MSNLSGLAAQIRACTTHDETFDLAGKNPDTISTNVKAAFEGAPFVEKKEGVMITFVTGAGKLARQKYHDDAAKAVTSALKNLGFVDERDATSVNQGTFKMQHDTGKNLKTVVVFPPIINNDSHHQSAAGDQRQEQQQDQLVPPKGCAVYRVSTDINSMFDKTMSTRLKSWSQKKKCIQNLEAVAEVLNQLQNKLIRGEALSDEQQDFYDTVTLDSIDTRVKKLRKAMAEQVEAGDITKREKDVLVKQVSEKLQDLEKQISSSQDKPKKLEKLKEAQKKGIERKTMLDTMIPSKVASHPLRNQPQIDKLRAEMRPLESIEDNAKGRQLLSIKETAGITRREEIKEEILQLELDSRDWFEDDDAFQERVEASRASAAGRNKKSTQKKNSTAPKSTNFANIGRPNNNNKPRISNSSAAGGWATVAAQKKPAVRAAAPVAKKKVASSGSMFAAMMDSDSDSD